MQSMEKCSPDPPTAPLGLASLQQGGGDLWHCWHVTPCSYWSPTSPLALIGRHSARKRNRDSGAGWRSRVMQLPEKIYQRFCPSDKRVCNPFLQSNTTARWEFPRHRPLKVQSGNAAVEPMRLLGLCTEQSIPQTPPSLRSLIEIFQQQVKE